MTWQSKPAPGLLVATALTAVALMCAGCGANPVLVHPGSDGDYAQTIPDAGTWTALAAREGSQALARVETVKVIVDKDFHQLYFTQSRRWPIHFEFAKRFLGGTYDHRAFNEREYHAPDRRFILGSITHYLDQDAWTFELFAGDHLGIDETIATFQHVKAVIYTADKLVYRPVPVEHQKHVAELRAKIPVITTDELFANLKYQPLELGEAWGHLRIVPAGSELPRDLHPYDIVVLGTQPIEIPVVAGIITDEIQAPLGHIAVLAHSRATPNMASRKATEQLASLDGKPVHLVVGASDFSVTPASPDELAKAGKARRSKAPTVRVDTRDAGMPTLGELDPEDIPRFGAKTAQLARVAHLRGIHTPRGFGLSFHAYAQYLAASGIDRMIAGVLGDANLRRDEARLHAALDQIRERMRTATIPPPLVAAIAARIAQVLPGSTRVRLRSSTNAEDLDGFSGAGLYESKKIDPAKPGDLERGLHEVWASVWSYDAYVEREWYGIDHAKVAMGILVQESIDDDVVNGVAITGNPFFEGRPAVYINAQVRGGSVTGAVGDEVPEQLLYYTYDTGESLERISDSSKARGTQLIPDLEAKAMASQLVDIHDEFTGERVGGERAVDVEFLIRKNRELVIVQARPYKMTWAGDRKQH